jgi:RHS repeat-associated protein
MTKKLLYVLVVVFLALPGSMTLAQTGADPYTSYTGGPDFINLKSLEFFTVVPVVHKSGRGVPFDYSLSYNSYLWQPVSSSGKLSWSHVSNFGWDAAQPGAGYANHSLQVSYCGKYTGVTEVYRNWVYHDGFGTDHALPFTTYLRSGTCGNGTTSATATTADPSAYTISVNGSNLEQVTSRDGLLLYAFGTFNGARDRNGNQVTGSASAGFTDTLGVKALTISGSSPNPVSYSYPGPQGSTSTVQVTYVTHTIQTNFGCASVHEWGPFANVALVDRVSLADGSFYQFTYELTAGSTTTVTGRVSSIKLPTGGTIYYQYPVFTDSNNVAHNGGISCVDGRTTAFTRTTPDGIWQYSGTSYASTYTTTVVDPLGNNTVLQFVGYETQRKIYSGSSTLLETIDTCYNGASSPCIAGTPATLPIAQRSVVTTIPGPGNLQSRHVDFYNSAGLPVETDDFDYGSGGPQSSPLRKTLISYTNLGATLGFVPHTFSVQDATGQTVFREDRNYDEYSSFAGPNCITGTTGHDDAGHGCTYTARGLLTSVIAYTDPVTLSGALTKHFTYDSLGNLRTADCCPATQWNYSAATNYAYPDTVVSGSGGSTLTSGFTYDTNTGLILTTTDPNSQKTSFTYDNMFRQTTVSRSADSSQITYTYPDPNAAVHIAKVTTPIQGASTSQQSTTFDGLGRGIRVVTSDSNSTSYSIAEVQYDALGRKYKTSNPHNSVAQYWTTTLLDPLGRISSVTLPDQSQTAYIYSDAIVTVKDPTGNQRKMQYDSLGRLSSVWEPDPSNGNLLTLQTSYSYSPFDDLTSVTQGSQVRTFRYDALGRLTASVTPESGTVCLGLVSGNTCQPNGYDSNGNVIHRTDARGVVTNYVYDTLNRLIGVAYSVPSGSGITAMPNVCDPLGGTNKYASRCFVYGVTPSQFNNGRVVTQVDGTGSEVYSYDSLGNTKQIQKTINSTSYNVQYNYNARGEMTSLTYPSGRVLQVNVDSIGRLASLVGSLNGINTTYADSFSFDPGFQVVGFRYGNGIYASIGFSRDRLELGCLDYSLTNRNGVCTHDSNTKFGLTYSYRPAPNNNGQIAAITDSVDNGKTVSFTYDGLSRISTASTVGSSAYPAWGLSMGYDRYGNRNSESILSGCVLPMTCPTNSVGIDPATNRILGDCYDASGNLTAESGSCPPTSPTYSYDGENHLAQYSASASYQYDGNGLRVRKCLPNCFSPTSSTVYIFSGSKVIAEYDNGAAVSSPSREYVYAGGSLIAKVGQAGVDYYHQDHLSNRLITDSASNTVAQLGHFPFGEAWYNGSGEKLFFTSYERDSESGNDYAMARYAVSRIGRFSSPDPLHGSTRNPQSLNRYSYTQNNPISFRDASGEDCSFPGDPGGIDMSASCTGAAGQPCDTAACNTFNWNCQMDGAPSPCSTVQAALSMGAAIQCPANNCTGISGVDRIGFFRNTVKDYFATLCSGSGAADDWSCILSPRGRFYLTFQNPLDVYFSGDNARIDWIFAQTYNAFTSDLKQSAMIGLSAVGPAAVNAMALEIGDLLLDSAAVAETETSITSIYSSKVLLRSTTDTGPNHNFPMTFDNMIIEKGEIGVLKPDYVEYQLPGILNGKSGNYEVGGDWSGGIFVIEHRFFRPHD